MGGRKVMSPVRVHRFSSNSYPVGRKNCGSGGMSYPLSLFLEGVSPLVMKVGRFSPGCVFGVEVAIPAVCYIFDNVSILIQSFFTGMYQEMSLLPFNIGKIKFTRFRGEGI